MSRHKPTELLAMKIRQKTNVQIIFTTISEFMWENMFSSNCIDTSNRTSLDNYWDPVFVMEINIYIFLNPSF